MRERNPGKKTGVASLTAADKDGKMRTQFKD